MPTTVMHIKTDRKTGKAAIEAARERAKEAGETVQEVAGHVAGPEKQEEKPERKLDVTTLVEKAPKTEAIEKEAEKGYDLIIIGMDKTVSRKTEFHDNVAAIAAGFEGPIAIADARDVHLKQPIEGQLSVLAPVNGTEPSRRAAEIAIVLAKASNAPLTALYVAPGGKKSSRSREYEEAILKDIVELAESYDLTIRTAVRSDVAPDEAIVKETARGRHNLVVMGVGRRPGDKLFLGDTAAALLSKSEKSLLFVAS